MFEECEGVEGKYERLDIQPLPEVVADAINRALKDLYREGTSEGGLSGYLTEGE